MESNKSFIQQALSMNKNHQTRHVLSFVCNINWTVPSDVLFDIGGANKNATQENLFSQTLFGFFYVTLKIIIIIINYKLCI